jgi:small GTP-binding protein
MMQKKICLLGTYAVGKTSLVRRFVYSVFSETYLTTVGVKIDRKLVSLPGCEMGLVIWDIQGEDEFAHLMPTYIRGASGCLLVADGTRQRTIETALDLARRVSETIGAVPFVLAVNKSDLRNDWEVREKDIESVRSQGWTVIPTSAKVGLGVEEAFVALADRIRGV